MLGDLPGPALFGLAMVAIGVVIVGVTSRYVWRSTGIYRAMAVDVLTDTAPGDLVRVTGTVHHGPDESLTAPFSGQPCQAIRYTIEERRPSPYGLPWFVTIHETAGSVPLRVRTPAAEVDVAAPAKAVTLERRLIETAGLDESPSERIERFERSTAGLSEPSLWRSPPGPLRPLASALSIGTRKYVEQRVGTGEAATVVGRVTEDGSVDPIVVSDRSPSATAYRMARTSLVGLLVGLGSVAFGVVLVVLV